MKYFNMEVYSYLYFREQSFNLGGNNVQQKAMNQNMNPSSGRLL